MGGRIDTETIMSPPRRVEFLRGALDRTQDGIAPLIDLFRPHVTGLETLPANGRFLLVATTLSLSAVRCCWFRTSFVGQSAAECVHWPIAGSGGAAALVTT